MSSAIFAAHHGGSLRDRLLRGNRQHIPTLAESQVRVLTAEAVLSQHSIGVRDAAHELASVPTQLQHPRIGRQGPAEAGPLAVGLHRGHDGVIVAENFTPQGMGTIHPFQGFVITHRLHINMVEAAVPFAYHHLPNENLRGIGPGHFLRRSFHIRPPAPADRAVVAVAHNPPNQPLHLAGRKGMPGRQGHAVPPCVIVVRKGIIVFLRYTGFDAVSYLALPGVQTPELRVAGSPYPVAKPQIQHAVAPVAAGLQGII